MSAFTSRSARAPTRAHKRRLTISEHAIERFRERVDEEFRHRNDNDLGNLLDERLGYAEFNYQVLDHRAPEAVTTLRSVACHHATYYAVVRDETVITVLDEAMARNNFEAWTPVLITANGPKILPAPPPPRQASLPAPAPAPSTEDPIAAVTEDPRTEVEVEVTTTSPPTAEDPLAEAGIAYARARRHQHECEVLVATIKAELNRAFEARFEAELAVENTHRRLVDLAGREDR